MVRKIREGGVKPRILKGNSWYSGVENLKFIINQKQGVLFGIEKNRIVSNEPQKYCKVSTLEMADEGWVTHLKEYGSVSLGLTPAFGPFPREVLFLLSAQTHQSRGFSNPYWQFTPSVPSATPVFGKFRNLTGLSPPEPIQFLLFQLIHACHDYKYWLLCHLSMVWCVFRIKLTQEAIGSQYCRQQIYSK